MSHLIAHGRAEIKNGVQPPETVRAHAFLNDDGTIEILAEDTDGDAMRDITITFPANAVAENVAKRIRGRSR